MYTLVSFPGRQGIAGSPDHVERNHPVIPIRQTETERTIAVRQITRQIFEVEFSDNYLEGNADYI
jgi:hypothetical protein